MGIHGGCHPFLWFFVTSCGRATLHHGTGMTDVVKGSTVIFLLREGNASAACIAPSEEPLFFA